MNKLKKLLYYLFNDPDYISSYIKYKMRSNKSFFFVILRYFFGISSFSNINKSSLLFVYDLELNPLTFNFGQHLANASIFSKKKSLKNIDLLIINSSSSNPIKTKKLKLFMSDHEANNRVYEIIVSTFRLSYQSNNLYLSSSKDKNIKNIIDSYKYIYPEGYSVIRPLPCPYKLPDVEASTFFPMLEPNLRGKEIIKKYLENFKDKKIITFTFRDLKHEVNRNSQYGEWLKFSEYLLKKNYKVIIVPDPLNYNPKYFEKFVGCHVAELVLWNINLRAALYEFAFLNCSVSSGIYEVTSFYNQKSNSLMFLDFNSYGKEYLQFGNKNWGYKDNIHQKWMSIDKSITYKKDNFENMVEAFNNLLDKKKISK